MESHSPEELGVVKRVRMEGVTFFHLKAAIKTISTMEILVSRIVMVTMMGTIGGNTKTVTLIMEGTGGMMTETDVKASHGPHD